MHIDASGKARRCKRMHASPLLRSTLAALHAACKWAKEREREGERVCVCVWRAAHTGRARWRARASFPTYANHFSPALPSVSRVEHSRFLARTSKGKRLTDQDRKPIARRPRCGKSSVPRPFCALFFGPGGGGSGLNARRKAYERTSAPARALPCSMWHRGQGASLMAARFLLPPGLVYGGESARHPAQWGAFIIITLLPLGPRRRRLVAHVTDRQSHLAPRKARTRIRA